MQKQEEQAAVYLELDQTQQSEEQHLITKKGLLRGNRNRHALLQMFNRFKNWHIKWTNILFPEDIDEREKLKWSE